MGLRDDAPAPARQRVRRIFRIFRIFLALLVLGFGLIAAEIGVRVMFPFLADPRQTMPQLGFKVFNDSYPYQSEKERRESRLAFTNRERIWETTWGGVQAYPPGTGKNTDYRLMLLGDSMFWGSQVTTSETIPAYLEEVGKKRAKGRTLKLWNVAFPGMNTADEYVMATRYLDQVHPDQVILGFFIANDILSNAWSVVDDRHEWGFDPKVAQKLEHDVTQLLGPLWSTALGRLAAVGLLYPCLRYRLSLRPEYLEPSFTWIEKIRALCEKSHARFSMVVFYPVDAVEGGLRGAFSQSRAVGARVVEHCRGKGIDVLDLIEHLHGSADRQKYFYAADGHPNREGNQRLAEIFYEELVAKHVDEDTVRSP